MYDKEIIPKLDKKLGYQYFLDTNHPLASKGGKIYYHRHILSLKLGRWLRKEEVAHHIDGDKANNVPENLELTSFSEHTRMHRPPSAPKKEIECIVCEKKTKNKRYCCEKCCRFDRRKVSWPSKEELRKDIDSMAWVAVGRKYGVSDNAVRKWAKNYGLISPRSSV